MRGSECVFLSDGPILWPEQLQPLETRRVGGGDRKPGMAETLSGTATLGPSEAGKQSQLCTGDGPAGRIPEGRVCLCVLGSCYKELCALGLLMMKNSSFPDRQPRKKGNMY